MEELVAIPADEQAECERLRQYYDHLFELSLEMYQALDRECPKREITEDFARRLTAICIGEAVGAPCEQVFSKQSE